MPISRRGLLKLCATVCGAFLARPTMAAVPESGGAEFGKPRPFDFDMLVERARKMADLAHSSPSVADADVLDRIDYSNHEKIWFLEKFGVWSGVNEPGPVHFFHPGKFFPDPVRIHLVEDGQAREILPVAGAFGYPAGHPAASLTRPPAYAGLRLLNKGTHTDWLSFLGKSYFRSSGPFDQYGLSARGVVIDAGLSTPEEFPRFSEFWLEDNDGGFTVYALLDGPSLAGAFRIVCRRDGDTDMDVDARLFARRDINRLGIAPLTSMFWYGENRRDKAVDWRPEIHDSDGLLMWNGNGESLWRPLNNPPRVMTNSFSDSAPRGFGLIQRDRAFTSYSDSTLGYDKRPSAWVEPIGDWGRGAVQLLEIPTDDEIHDNIAAYWVSDSPMRKGDDRTYRYRLSWTGNVVRERGRGRVVATRAGTGGVPEQRRPVATRRFVIDFETAQHPGLTGTNLPDANVTVSRGRLLRKFVVAVPETDVWRLVFDLEADGDDALDLRADLSRQSEILTETWIYQTFPASWPNARSESVAGD